LDKPRGFQEVETPSFQDSRRMKCTGRLYTPPGNVPAAGTIMSMKNSKDSIGKRTRDLSAFSAVPQPTAPPHTLVNVMYLLYTYIFSHTIRQNSYMLRSVLDQIIFRQFFLNHAYIKHKYLNRLKVLSIKFVDVIIFVVEGQQNSTYPE